MASSLPDKSRNLIDDFLKFTKRIALEIVQADIEIAIYLIDKNLPKDKALEIRKAAQPGVVLVSCLKEYRLLSENNLDFFIELLEECRRVDLANRVKEYQKTSVNTVKDAPQAQIEEKIPGELNFIFFHKHFRQDNFNKITIHSLSSLGLYFKTLGFPLGREGLT